MTHPALHEPPTFGHADSGHFVPEGWEDVERGICPCGEAVTWDDVAEVWTPDRSLVVLVLTTDEVFSVTDRLRRAGTTAARATIDRQLVLNEPLD